MRILEKISEFIFGEKPITQACDKIVQSKELTDNEKLDKILHAYSRYCGKKYYNDVAMATYERYYDKFMIDGVKNDLNGYLFNKVAKDINYLIAVRLSSQINSLKNLMHDELTAKQAEIVKETTYLRTNFFNQDFDFTSFYNKEEIREIISDEDDKLIKLVRDYNKSNEREIDKN